MFEVVVLEKHAIPRNPSRKLQFEPGPTEEYCSQIFQQARNRKSIIHVLQNVEEEWHGFVALRFDVLAKRPSLVIDYLITSLQYRGMRYNDLGGLKISEYLIAYALSKAADVNLTVPVRYLALEPASDELAGFYGRNGFSRLDATDWMFMKVPMPIPMGVPA